MCTYACVRGRGGWGDRGSVCVFVCVREREGVCMCDSKHHLSVMGTTTTDVWDVEWLQSRL